MEDLKKGGQRRSSLLRLP